jgi:hypothetical protein
LLRITSLGQKILFTRRLKLRGEGKGKGGIKGGIGKGRGDKGKETKKKG